MITFWIVQVPACSLASAPTESTPEGWPKRTRPSAPTGATRDTTVPGMAAAAAMVIQAAIDNQAVQPRIEIRVSPETANRR